jgi:hypothetical protein
MKKYYWIKTKEQDWVLREMDGSNIHIINDPEHFGCEVQEIKPITENTSDGYHTFKELYEFRMLYNANLFNEWYKQNKYNVHKSYYHNDGEKCFGGGWFIVMATTPEGQISNHYENKHWNLFHCEIKEKADKWDGHTAQDVVKTLTNLTKGSDSQKEEL